MSTSQFVNLALQAFSLGYGLGFAHWAISFAVRMIRKSFVQGMKIPDL